MIYIVKFGRLNTKEVKIIFTQHT